MSTHSLCVLHKCVLYVVATICATFCSKGERVLENNYWKISDFAKKLGKHNNTVDGWFRTLETEKHLHFVSRINGEKVYDELDYQIATYIIEKRNNKWSLDAIFDDLPNHFSLRPFPPEYELEKTSVQVVDVDKIRASIMQEMKTSFEEIAAAQMEKQMSNLQKILPSPEEKRIERFEQIMAERKVTRQLEDEALSIWSTKPEEERLIKVGWFRREEDKEKRDRFVRDYIDEHFEKRMKEEFGLD